MKSTIHNKILNTQLPVPYDKHTYMQTDRNTHTHTHIYIYIYNEIMRRRMRLREERKEDDQLSQRK